LSHLHILHCESATGWGGQEIRVFQETGLLLERGHSVDIVCQSNTPLSQHCETLNHPNFRFFCREMKSSFHPASLAGVYRLLKKLRPHIVHTHSSVDSWQFTLMSKLLGIPVVRSRHVSLPIRGYFPNSWLYSSPDRIITSGQAISDIVTQVRGVKSEHVTSVSAGVDLRRFDCNISGAEIRKSLGVVEGQPLIGKIGVIRGFKGHNQFLDAIPVVLEKIPSARFVIVGDGPGFEEIKGKVKAKGLNDSTTLLGHRSDVPEIMAACDVLTLASTSGEGTPQVIPQAFAMKTPMVATRIGSTPDLLDQGQRGVLVEPGSGTALAQGILHQLSDPTIALEKAERAYQYCREKLTDELMILQTIKVYDSIVSSRSPHSNGQK
jgi:glycosyltransferase involved in cell wall biosynthesis